MATVSDNFTQEVLRLTNIFRQKNGLSPLSANAELNTTAQRHSKAMATGDFFSHEGKDGSAPWDRARAEGYTASTMGENIAAGWQSPKSVVDDWINSPDHRANLLNSRYTELGVGYFNLENDTGKVNYGTYWTQLFGSGDLTPSTPKPPAPTPRPQPKPPVLPPVLPPADRLPKAVAELSFEEATGKVAKDTSTGGMNNSAKLSGGVERVDGKAGQAISLSGKGDVATFKDSKDINLGIHAQRSVSMWFKVDKPSSNRKQVLYEEGGTVRGLNAYVEDDKLYVGGWNQQESQWDGSWIDSDKIKAGKWHHAAIVLDGKAAVTDDALTVYLDGKQIGQAEGSQLWQHPDRISLGNVSGQTRFDDGIGRNGAHGLAGAIDEVKIFNSALTDSQVQGLATV